MFVVVVNNTKMELAVYGPFRTEREADATIAGIEAGNGTRENPVYGLVCPVMKLPEYIERNATRPVRARVGEPAPAGRTLSHI